MKPRIFIGSSTEGLYIAEAIQQNLSHNFDVNIWSQGIFNLSSFPLVNLVDDLELSDLAIFVFSGDDVVKMRNHELVTARDNVIFEMGLYIGKLGMKHVFFLVPDISDFHLPTDLSGFSAFRYDRNKRGGNLLSELGPFCTQIKSQVFDGEGRNLNLSGLWSERWRLDGSQSQQFEPLNEDQNVRIVHIGDIVSAYFVSSNRRYRIKGTIRNNFITGIWEDVNNGPTYHGAFQLKIIMGGETMSGVWSGFDSQGNINSNVWEWKRQGHSHYPSER